MDVASELIERTNCVFLGTNVRSGTARCLIVNTGSATEFGAIAHRLTLRPPDTEFDRGVRRFGYLLTGAMLIMVLLVFVAHMFRGRPPVETLLFSIALAVPYLPFAGVVGFVPLPGALLGAIVLITMLYVAATELQKMWFYRGAHD